MKVKFYKDSFLYAAVSVVAALVNLFLIPFLTRALSKEEYGLVEFLNVIFFFAQVAVALEISQAISRFFADGGGEADRQSIASTGLYFVVAMSAIFLLLCMAFADSIAPRLLDLAEGGALIRWVSLSISLRIVFQTLLGQLRWKLMPLNFVVVSMFSSVGSALLTVLFLGMLHTGIVGVFYALSLANLLAGLLALRFLRGTYILRFDPGQLKTMLAFSTPLVVSSLAVFVTNNIDRVLIKEHLSLADLAVYGVSLRIAAIINLGITGFQMGVAPLIYSNYRNDDTRGMIAQVARIYLLLCLFFVSFLGFFAAEILMLLVPAEYSSGARIIPLAALAGVLANFYIFAPGLTLANRTRAFAIVNIAISLINLGLNLILIPRMQIAGAACAALISGAASAVLHVGFNQRLYHIPFAWRRLAPACLLALIAAGLAWFPDIYMMRNILTKGVSLVLFTLGLSLLLLDRYDLNKLKSQISSSWSRLAGSL